MGLYDRDYTQADPQRQHFGSSQLRFSLPHITPVVKWLLVANIGIHILQVALFTSAMRSPLDATPLERIFAVDPSSLSKVLQLWRLVGYQFLHGDGWHIFGNMLGLFFLGPTLERHWGGKRFLMFYLGCGIIGGLSYTFLVGIGLLKAALPMVGASGAILGMLMACAILFPQFVVFIIVFPVPIRIASIGFILLFVINIFMQGPNAGGDAAHLGGMAAGAAYVLFLPKWERIRLRMHTQSWEKRLEESRKLRVEVDRLLAKVHRSGLHSLTTKERRLLKRATQEEVRRHQML